MNPDIQHPPSSEPLPREFRPGGYREMLTIATPLIISMASFTLMQFADRIFLARYSAEAIQASLPAGILAFTLMSFFHALVGYAGTFVAQYHGAGSKEGCSRSTAQGIWMSFLSLPLLWALIPVGGWILVLANHPPAVLAEEKIYFDLLMAGGFLM
ncbi:MAG: MATE family efflux transporter, partial [Kiritimatiellia bacterium]|nr:MATE family efflux transporter [Kiritimatiellia bacterium]